MSAVRTRLPWRQRIPEGQSLKSDAGEGYEDRFKKKSRKTHDYVPNATTCIYRFTAKRDRNLFSEGFHSISTRP